MSKWEYFEPSRPREPKGGIKAQSGRGSFGKNWWARRWIETLESFDIGARLARGRTYARKGQVLDIGIVSGMVQARVQGSRATPYKVSIGVTTLTDVEWKRVIGALAGQASFLAQLLSGELRRPPVDAAIPLRLGSIPFW